MSDYEERYKSVQELKARGLGIKPIGRELGMGRNTVRKYYYAANAQEVEDQRKCAPKRTHTACANCGTAFKRPMHSKNCASCRRDRAATATERDTLIAEHGSQCGICGKPETASEGEPRTLGVDSRGQRLLCAACRNLLGLFRYDSEMLISASRYIERHRTTANPWNQPVLVGETNPDEQLAERTRLLIQWRDEGVIFKEIGKRLGISKQRAIQIWQRIQSETPLVRTCWCGNPIPETAESGRPRHFCSDEHGRRNGNPSGPPNEWYEQQRQRQRNKCAICNQSETVKDRQSGAIKELAADHNHETGAYRELLCTRCNVGIGLAREEPAIFAAAAGYLRRYQQAA